MAQVTTRKLAEGPGKLMLHVWLESDGSGELNDFELMSPADLVPAQEESPTLRILQVWHAFVGFDAVLKFGGIVPRPVWRLTEVANGHVDFRHFGGLADYASVPPSDDNGKLLLSTQGFVGGKNGSIVIEFRK